MASNDKTIAAIASPVKKKKSSTNASGEAKYHFCYSPVDMRKSKRMYSMVEKIIEDDSFLSNVLKPTEDHYVYLYYDKEHLTHIDFIGESWTYSETDVVFDKIRSEFRANNMYFAFTNYKED